MVELRGGTVVKNPPASVGDARDLSSIPGLGRSGDGNSNLLQYSCLENPRDREAWMSTVYGVTMNRTQLSMHAHTQNRLLNQDGIYLIV